VVVVVQKCTSLTVKVDEDQDADGVVISDVMQRIVAVHVVVSTVDRYRRRRPETQRYHMMLLDNSRMPPTGVFVVLIARLGYVDIIQLTKSL